jgi:hypothetical protein
MNTGLLSSKILYVPEILKNHFLYKVRLTIHGPVPYLYFTLGRVDPDPQSEPRDGVLGHQFNKRLGSFAQCYSQCLPQADFKENHRYSSLVLKILTKNTRNKKTQVYS